MKKAETCNNVALLTNIPVEADALKVRFLNEISAHVARSGGDGGGNGDGGDPVRPQVKKHKTVSIRTINTATTWQLETKEDVERYIQTLQTKLNALLEKDTIVNIEF